MNWIGLFHFLVLIKTMMFPPPCCQLPACCTGLGSTESASFGVFFHPFFQCLWKITIVVKTIIIKQTIIDCDNQSNTTIHLAFPLAKEELITPVRTPTLSPPARQPSNPAPKTRVKIPRSGTVKGRVPWASGLTIIHACRPLEQTKD